MVPAPKTERRAPSCHDDAPGGPIAEGTPVVALIGNPNVGKSSLFNALTGASRSIGNWPGTTVEVGRGELRDRNHGRQAHPIALLDLPGAYSLDAASPDEELTADLILGPGSPPDAVVVVADAHNLGRSLYIVTQLRERALRVVVALSMVDVADAQGIVIDDGRLGSELGVRVVRIDARRCDGVDALMRTVREVLSEPPPAPRTVRRPATASPDESEVGIVGERSALEALEERFESVADALAAAVVHDEAAHRSLTARLDRVVLAPVVGPIVFLLVMLGVFELTTTVAAPLQGWLDSFVSGPVSRAAGSLIDAAGLGNTFVRDLVVNGLIAGVGMLFTFVPVMAVMFCCLAILENTGYLARAAVVADRVMRTIGLPGRAFLPLIVGFGCNVPAISAARILPDARQRLLVTMVVPYTSCSARLSVYVLVATAFFGQSAGLVVFGLYVVSILLVVLIGLLLKSTVIKGLPSDPLLIDLPAYQWPLPKMIGVLTWTRLKSFLRTASGVIVVTVTLVWLATAIPVREGSFANVEPRNSVYGALSVGVAPAFKPAGFGDWHTAAALITGFVAKEAVISTWSQTYSTDEPAADSEPGRLGGELRRDFERTSRGHASAAVLAFLVFLLAYTPCVATLAAQRREIGARWTAFSVGINLAVAWLAAVLVFQIGRLVT